MTRIDSDRKQAPTNAEAQDSTNFVEYSAREVSPPALLIQQLLRAHQIFLLHQSPSLSELWVKLPRQKFCGLLKRFWDNFIWNWDVLLHGNPAVDIYNGLKLSAGGELGVGADEANWGSGEREVLEGFVGRTEGLVDLVVSQFGDPEATASENRQQVGQRFGTGRQSEPSDGVIFSGIGALTRPSVRNIANWVEWISVSGENTFGVRENPSASGRRKRKGQAAKSESKKGSAPTPRIPPSIVSQYQADKETSKTLSEQSKTASSRGSTDENYAMSTDTIIKYLTLGVYGSSWGIPSGRSQAPPKAASLQDKNQTPTKASSDEDLTTGFFVIGLLGDLEEQSLTDEEVAVDAVAGQPAESPDRRIVIRTLHVERLRGETQPENYDARRETTSESYFDRLRVVVYVQPPFIFTLLFETETYSLAFPSFYRSLHHQLGPLRKPLQTMTSPDRVRERLKDAIMPRSTAPVPSTQPINNLVYDPARLTIHTSIPNIPEAGLNLSNGEMSLWTRAEAITVHSQIVNTYTSTRWQRSELEQTSKTSRGWWVVWMRLPHSLPPTLPSANSSRPEYREAFLIRKASDYNAPTARASGMSARWRGSPSSGRGPSDSANKLAEGIGIDARQYVEGLLSLSR